VMDVLAMAVLVIIALGVCEECYARLAEHFHWRK